MGPLDIPNQGTCIYDLWNNKNRYPLKYSILNVREPCELSLVFYPDHTRLLIFPWSFNKQLRLIQKLS